MVAGQWIAGTKAVAGSGDPLDILNPATGEVVDTVTLATAADVDTAVAAAKAAFTAWSTATPGERSTVLHDLAARDVGTC